MARIMVVEDDVYMREELTDLLRKSGYETASLFDFENAIPEITEYSPDLVLLDPNTFTIYVGKSSSLMPPNEGKILLALLKKSPNLVTKHELCNVLWGTEECIDENALQVTFTRLRKTLREFGLEERIETVRGQGYRLKEQVRL